MTFGTVSMRLLMLRSAESGSSTTWRAVVVVPIVGARLVELDRLGLPTTVIASPTPATGSTLSVTSLRGDQADVLVLDGREAGQLGP